MTHRIIHPDGWKPAKGHANGMLGADGTLYAGGQIGWTGDQVFVARYFIGQMEQALRNILTVVTAAGGRAENILRLTWFVTDKKTYLANQSEVGAITARCRAGISGRLPWWWSRTKHCWRSRRRPSSDDRTGRARVADRQVRSALVGIRSPDPAPPLRPLRLACLRHRSGQSGGLRAPARPRPACPRR